MGLISDEEMLKLINPQNGYEWQKTIATLGEKTCSILFSNSKRLQQEIKIAKRVKDIDILCPNCQLIMKIYEFTLVCPECSLTISRDIYSTKDFKNYRQPEALKKPDRHRLKKLLKNVYDTDVKDRIRFFFGILFELFDKHSEHDRINFTSYSYFINRILEHIGEHELKKQLAFKEPKTDIARKRAKDLWQLFLNSQ